MSTDVESLAPRKTPKVDLITIEFKSAASDDEDDLRQYLAKTLQVPILYELAESENWHPTVSTLPFVAAAVPLVKYAGKKLIDVLADLLRTWLQTHPQTPEIVIYDADGKAIKVSRK